MIYPGAEDPCAECAKALNDGLIEDQKCDRCEYDIHLLPENVEPWNLAMLAAPGLFQPDGGVDYQALAVVFDVCGVPQEERKDLLRRILGVIEARQDKLDMDAEKARRRTGRG